MGVAQAGIAFRPGRPIGNLKAFVSRVMGQPVEEIPHPDSRQFDVRRATDIMVQDFDGALFICNDTLAWPHLENTHSDIAALHGRLGAPASFMLFCHYSSGGSFGYAFVDGGMRTRSRLQTMLEPRLPPLIEYGMPTAIEKRWLSAPSYLEEDDCPPEERQRIFYLDSPRVEVYEDGLTQQILLEALEERFGVCPWTTNVEPIYRFYKVREKRPWWQRLGLGRP
ncbi:MULTISPECIES: hypothetical protein [unclassified Variovorax]|uniref:hypothetical protein n=1 Tax=unclassified Variovorax TaxID=663243 RepID=UPI0008ABA2AB|nr:MULTISPECIES: hypothetical protein [unclassified Variovorax]SEK14938.1 hypothetical protein SAMN05518853_11626 [Variovorax sp. OK202]SFE06650.1 hypothetical protein SAMN05444746_11626 [Variovorax sp. OK212]